MCVTQSRHRRSGVAFDAQRATDRSLVVHVAIGIAALVHSMDCATHLFCRRTHSIGTHVSKRTNKQTNRRQTKPGSRRGTKPGNACCAEQTFAATPAAAAACGHCRLRPLPPAATAACGHCRLRPLPPAATTAGGSAAGGSSSSSLESLWHSGAPVCLFVCLGCVFVCVRDACVCASCGLVEFAYRMQPQYSCAPPARRRRPTAAASSGSSRPALGRPTH